MILKVYHGWLGKNYSIRRNKEGLDSKIYPNLIMLCLPNKHGESTQNQTVSFPNFIKPDILKENNF